MKINTEAADQAFQDEMVKLQAERDCIIADASRAECKRFLHIECELQLHMKVAANNCHLKIADMRDHYLADIQQANDQFQLAKRRLQCTMLDNNSPYERLRSDSLQNPGVTKWRRRGRTSAFYRQHLTDALQNEMAIFSLEQQRVLRVALTPDEVNADFQSILRGINSARVNGSST